MLHRLAQPGSIVDSDVASKSPHPNYYNVRLNDLALNCDANMGAILVNFAKESGKSMTQHLL